jgi:hypothetical protein
MPGRHWTRAQRAKQSALIQNWKPWTKAGVRTAEGKAISSRNAFKGGTRPMFRGMAALLKEQKEQLKRFT